MKKEALNTSVGKIEIESNLNKIRSFKLISEKELKERTGGNYVNYKYSYRNGKPNYKKRG